MRNGNETEMEEMPVNQSCLPEVAERLATSRHIAILPHQNADGDALGAAIALGLGLETKGMTVDVLLEEPVPKMLSFLPGLRLVREAAAPPYDIALNIDNGDLTRLGVRQPVYWGAACRLSIDHHATNHVVANVSHVDTTAAATGEIVRDLLALLEIPLTHDIATCLYTAILTDTGGFRFTNTTPRTHQIAAELMAFGVDSADVAKRVFDTVSMAKLQMMKQVMNHLQLYEDGLLAVSFLRPEDIRLVDGVSGDFEGMVNIGRNLEGVEVSLFVREEEPGQIKGSLRSNECVDVAKIAETVEGGGHMRAAGFAVQGELDGVIAMLRDRIIEAIRACHGKERPD